MSKIVEFWLKKNIILHCLGLLCFHRPSKKFKIFHELILTLGTIMPDRYIKLQLLQQAVEMRWNLVLSAQPQVIVQGTNKSDRMGGTCEEVEIFEK